MTFFLLTFIIFKIFSSRRGMQVDQYMSSKQLRDIISKTLEESQTLKCDFKDMINSMGIIDEDKYLDEESKLIMNLIVTIFKIDRLITFKDMRLSLESEELLKMQSELAYILNIFPATIEKVSEFGKMEYLKRQMTQAIDSLINLEEKIKEVSKEITECRDFEQCDPELNQLFVTLKNMIDKMTVSKLSFEDDYKLVKIPSPYVNMTEQFYINKLNELKTYRLSCLLTSMLFGIPSGSVFFNTILKVSTYTESTLGSIAYLLLLVASGKATLGIINLLRDIHGTFIEERHLRTKFIKFCKNNCLQPKTNFIK